MPTHHQDQQAGEHADERHLAGQPKAAVLPVNETDEQTATRLEQEAIDAGLRHPNRGTDKAELDKPAYGGGH